jgi:hypothetical protein
MKRCAKCQEDKPKQAFGIAQGKLRSYCKECRRKDSAEYRRTHLEASRKSVRNWMGKHRDRAAKASRDWHFRNRESRKDRARVRRYGAGAAQYTAFCARQGGLCAICRERNTKGRDLAIDHDHSTGRIRGLLCTRCNLLLGLAKDSVDRLLEAALYLEKGRSQ